MNPIARKRDVGLYCHIRLKLACLATKTSKIIVVFFHVRSFVFYLLDSEYRSWDKNAYAQADLWLYCSHVTGFLAT